MANICVNQGLQRIGINASAVGTTPGTSFTTSRWIQTISVDDSANAFTATDTALNSGGAVTNEFDALLDAAATRSGQVITHVMTVPTGSGNFTIKRVALHDDTATNVTTSSTSLVAGIDAQSIGKTSNFSLALTVTLTYTSV